MTIGMRMLDALLEDGFSVTLSKHNDLYCIEVDKQIDVDAFIDDTLERNTLYFAIYEMYLRYTGSSD